MLLASMSTKFSISLETTNKRMKNKNIFVLSVRLYTFEKLRIFYSLCLGFIYVLFLIVC